MSSHIKLKELIQVLENLKIEEGGDVEVGGIAYDSRRVNPGDLFVAIRGLDHDGHEFISDAISRGASALVVERRTKHEARSTKSIPVIRVPDTRRALAQISSKFYGEPSRKMKMIGITGTNGKTTTSYLLKSILEKGGMKVGLIGTIDYWIGGERRKAEKTTPESPDLQKTLSEMRSSDVKAVVMEVSSHGLALQRTEGIDFDVALFTNLSRDHLDFHRTMTRYSRAKMILFEGLTEGKKAILNSNDPFTEKIRKRTKAEVITYGLESPEPASGGRDRELIENSRSGPRPGRLKSRDRAVSAHDDEKIASDYSGVSLSRNLEGSEMEVRWRGRKVTLHSHLPGRLNLYNLLGAFAFGISEGISIESVLKGIEEVKGIEGRLEAIEVGQPFKVFVDYAHTPDALKKVLMSLKELTSRRVVVIFGCGGGRDRGKRPIMARVGTTHADFAILTSDNPRHEDPQNILNDMKKGVLGNEYEVIPDRREAIERGVDIAKEGDTLLIAGKGHEDYQIIGEEYLPFDDRKVVREILEEKMSGRGLARGGTTANC
ncbi:UDP-N-acetylmuramoyl-L-alanyl-D-glutamate--2,6-diaminopimelate ligase [candidate division TA06 bacterium]|nr:UDP-N-acetylmuramoyl-L-alanyl-D-glutamate--2,6-diaminopimelate ligase [candidate division TA06 bacterium]